MHGALLAALDTLPPYDWGTLDPTTLGDPVHVIPGVGAAILPEPSQSPLNP